MRNDNDNGNDNGMVRLVSHLGMIAVAGTLLGGLAEYHWIADIAVQLRVQYAILLLVSIATWAYQQSAFRLVVGLLALSVNLWFTVPYCVAPRASSHTTGDPARVDQPSLRLMIVNVLRTNQAIEETLQAVWEEDADFVFLMEVAPDWRPPLVESDKSYPFQHLMCREDYTGVAFLSRHRWHELKVVPAHAANSPLEIIFPLIVGQPAGFQLCVTHPLPPLGRQLTDLRDQQLRRLAERCRAIGAHSACLLAGDLNVTPWSPRFDDVLRAGHLADASRGYGISPTLTPLPTLLGGLKVDHVLVNDRVIVEDYRLKSIAHSDHRAVIIDFRVSEPASTDSESASD